MDFKELIRKYAKPDSAIGIIGYGAFGHLIAEEARTCGLHLILNDPPFEQAQSGDIYEEIFTLWGNGMGGCESDGADFENFMPLPILLKCADLVSIQVPLTFEGPCPTAGMINESFLSMLKNNAVTLNFSGSGIVSHQDPRIIDCSK